MSTKVTPDSIVLPPSPSTVSVKIFNAFRSLALTSVPYLSAAPGSTADESTRRLECSGKSFLLEHPSGRKIVYDLGIRKDESTAVKAYREAVGGGHLSVEFGPDVSETLTQGGVDLATIEAVIVRSANHLSDVCRNI
jgi:hypothetical protein